MYSSFFIEGEGDEYVHHNYSIVNPRNHCHTMLTLIIDQLLLLLSFWKMGSSKMPSSKIRQSPMTCSSYWGSCCCVGLKDDKDGEVFIHGGARGGGNGGWWSWAGANDRQWRVKGGVRHRELWRPDLGGGIAVVPSTRGWLETEGSVVVVGNSMGGWCSAGGCGKGCEREC